MNKSKVTGVGYQPDGTGNWSVYVKGRYVGVAYKSVGATSTCWGFSNIGPYQSARLNTNRESSSGWGGWKRWDATRDAAVVAAFGRVIDGSEPLRLKGAPNFDLKRIKPARFERRESGRPNLSPLTRTLRQAGFVPVSAARGEANKPRYQVAHLPAAHERAQHLEVYAPIVSPYSRAQGAEYSRIVSEILERLKVPIREVRVSGNVIHYGLKV